MDQTKYKTIDCFCQKVLDEKKYFRHSDIDLYINIRLKGILNYQNILSKEDILYINENFNKNHRYITEIETEKIQKEKKSLNPGGSKNIPSNSILNFSYPQFELYFVIKLIVNGLVIEPEQISELVLTQEFNENIIFRYRYKDLTPDSCICVNIHSMQLPQDKSLIASSTVNLFDEEFNLVQGKHVFNLWQKIESDLKTRMKTSGKLINNPIYSEIDLLMNSFSNLKTLKDNYQGINENSNLNYEERLNFLLTKTEYSFIQIEFPVFNNSVIYEEEKSNIGKDFYKCLKLKSGDNITNWVSDPEIRRGKNFLSKDNPITEKFSILSRISDDAFARDIKPSPYEMKRIEELLNTPDFIKLEDSDTILFWKYRYFLLNKKNSLTKILNSVKWGEAKSENEVIKNILTQWNQVEISEILYMLSYKFCMNPIYVKNIYPKMQEIRQFAVKHLEKLHNTEINFILLQLVQALRYEDESTSSLRKFLINRCGTQVELATSFYWFLRVEADDSGITKSKEGEMMIAMYKVILKDLEKSLNEVIADQINSQVILREKLILISNELGKVSKAENKRKRLIQTIKKDGLVDMHKLNPPLQLPIDPDIKINGVIVDQCRIFTSAKYPVKFTFTVTNDSQELIDKDDPSVFDIMYKYGDDLRQDQLILQIISYMDNLLKNVHLDFEFTTYKVLATSKSDGFVEFVPNCSTIFDVLKKFDDQILPYLKQISNNSDTELEKNLDSFINSCAGYCVVTYILGIGDRHLENLLIDKKGRLFHIDFGYILGKDPKLYPPPMKLCKQMVECMGGKNSKGYEDFKKRCVDAYLYLRSNARLVVNMFYLMIHCGINELSESPEHVLNKLHEKFVPGLNPQEASNSLLNKLEESVNAFYPYLMEKFHAWANYWK